MATEKELDISHSSGRSGVSDVTDDGNIVVGECTNLPAYWSREKGDWVTLPLPEGMVLGRLNCVTPDGHYAAGYGDREGKGWLAYPIMYDLTTGKLIDLPNIPTLDMTHLDQGQNCVYGLSADGRYLACAMSESYLMPASLCAYVYDRQNATYRMLGFDDNATAAWTPKWDNLHFVERPSISDNGKWITGSAYMVEPIPGSEYPNEFRATYKYDVEKDEFVVYDKAGEADIVGSAVLNDGTIIGGSPANNPYAYCYIRSGNYYIALEQILKQVYNIDFKAVTNITNTGYPLASSADGLTWLMSYAPDETYLIQFKEPIAEAAAKVNLLGNYTAAPVSSSKMTNLSEVRITFDRDVETNGLYNKITCVSEDGQESWTPVQGNGFVAQDKQVVIVFRTRQMREGVNYTLTIPAGLVRVKGDRNMTSPQIKLTFTGRGTGAVTLTRAYPEDGASVAGLDLTTNPMLLTFDANLKLKASPATAYLYREGESAPYCNLNVLCSKNQILVYPLTGQHLYNGTDYKVVIPAGTVTDLSGAGDNEEITLRYKGSYVRTVSADDKLLFSSTCDNYTDFMFYDGDHNTPAEIPASWGFTVDYPWILTRSTVESSDMCLASHSMYTPAGTSNDWMSTPQIFIPDEDCYLRFDAQSYLKSKNDRLKVIVLASNNVYDSFTNGFLSSLKDNGVVVFDKQLSPGASEEDLEGDWQTVSIPLADFAGKDVYVAFVNENTDASAIFIDNVQVIHDMRYLASFQTPTRVVAQESAEVKGTVAIATEMETYDAITMVLRNAAGAEIDRISRTGLSLKKDDIFEFAFAKPLPLVLGEVNKYSVDITLGDRTTTVSNEVRNLTFEPQKRIVVEEYSGAECSNCPMGFAALENIESLYPQNVLPVILRTYNSDVLTSGMGSYTSFLAFSGAPSARINRGPVTSPMVRNGDDYMLSGKGYVDSETGEPLTTWLDVFNDELAEPSDADITFSSSYVEGESVKVDFSVKSALNLTGTAVNVFAVITEDKISTYQTSNVYASTDPDLGKWGANGIYGSNFIYPFEISDVARYAYGTTFNGTGGLVPATLEAGREYTGTLNMLYPATLDKPENCFVTLMLIEAATGRILNANRCPLNGTNAGVDDIIATPADAPVIAEEAGNVTVTGNGTLQADAYSVDGVMLATAAGEGAISLDLNGYRGMVIVRATDASGKTAVTKVVIR